MLSRSHPRLSPTDGVMEHLVYYLSHSLMMFLQSQSLLFLSLFFFSYSWHEFIANMLLINVINHGNYILASDMCDTVQQYGSLNKPGNNKNSWKLTRLDKEEPSSKLVAVCLCYLLSSFSSYIVDFLGIFFIIIYALWNPCIIRSDFQRYLKGLKNRNRISVMWSRNNVVTLRN